MYVLSFNRGWIHDVPCSPMTRFCNHRFKKQRDDNSVVSSRSFALSWSEIEAIPYSIWKYFYIAYSESAWKPLIFGILGDLSSSLHPPSIAFLQIRVRGQDLRLGMNSVSVLDAGNQDGYSG